MVELERVVGRGLFATAALWAPLHTAHRWIAEAARMLANEEGTDAATVETALRALRTEVVTFQDDQAVGEWATHFYKVTMNLSLE